MINTSVVWQWSRKLLPDLIPATHDRQNPGNLRANPSFLLAILQRIQIIVTRFPALQRIGVLQQILPCQQIARQDPLDEEISREIDLVHAAARIVATFRVFIEVFLRHREDKQTVRLNRFSSQALPASPASSSE